MKCGLIFVLLLFASCANVCLAEEPQFFIYQNCRPQDTNDVSGQKLSLMLQKLRDSLGSKVLKNGFFDIPASFAKKNILPLIGTNVYRYENSKFVGVFKVTKAMYESDEEFGWYDGYLTDDEKQKYLPSPDRERVEVAFSGKVDVKKIKEINSDNNDYLASYTLSDAQVQTLKKKVVQFFQKSESDTLDDLEPLPGDWQEVSTVGFSTYLRIRKQTLAIFNYDNHSNQREMKWGPRLIVFKTKDKLFAYQGTFSTRFKQFIDWFGDYYVVIGGNHDNYIFDEVYKLTPDGLVKVAEGGYAGD
jgi:hypothetical protein